MDALHLLRERAEEARDQLTDHVEWCKAHEIVDIIDDVIMWTNYAPTIDALSWLYNSYKRVDEEAARYKHLLITMSTDMVDYEEQQTYYKTQLTKYEQKKQDWTTFMKHFYNVTPEEWGKVYDWRKRTNN